MSQPLVVNISPLGFHRFARDLLTAESSFPPQDGFSIAPYYLLSRVIELGLKAFLLARGVVQNKPGKRNLGHNLDAILRQARRAGLEGYLSILPNEESAIRLANAYYSRKGFEYFVVDDAARGYRDLPSLADLREFAGKLLKQTRRLCDEA